MMLDVDDTNGTSDHQKRKREEKAEGSTARSRLDIPALELASLSPGMVDSPLHSPTSSSGHLPTTSNGNHPSRRSNGKLTRRRNIDQVHFGAYDIKTWYYSPYQFEEEEWAAMAAASSSNGNDGNSTPTSTSKTTRQASISHSSNLAESLVGPKPGGALSTSAEHAPALQATNGEGHHQQNDEPSATSIWICDGCFKYMRTYSGFKAHKRQCKFSHPPGKKVYQRGAHTIWEVDGVQQKLYCQNLSLFGKLFIDHKTIYFDVEPFVFYVLTDAAGQFDHVLGYFSKEKVSYDDYNLACIITFPPFQKQGFGTLMIEFSYYLSSLTLVSGTPERPLSDLGLKGYLSFWSAVALRTLALFFFDQDPDVQARILPTTVAASTSSKAKQQSQSTVINSASFQQRLREESLRIRRILLGVSSPKDKQPSGAKAKREARSSEAGDGSSSFDEGRSSRRSMKGWAGEVSVIRKSLTTDLSENEKVGENAANDHELLKIDEDKNLDQQEKMIELKTTLERLSEATNLRIEDLTLALSECGLLQQQSHHQGMTNQKELQLIIMRKSVREMMQKLNVKRPILDVQYALV